MTIFQMKDGNVEPIAIIKAGKTTKVGTRRRGRGGAGGPGARHRRPAPATAPATDAPKK